MEKAVRKMYISMLTAVLVLITAITSSYAWFGIDFGHYIEEFQLSFDSSGAEGLEISLDGVNFSNYLTTKEIQRHILDNRGISYNELTLEKKFQEVASISATTTLVNNNNLEFKDLHDSPDSLNHLSFTFYVKPSYIVGPEDIPEDGIFKSDHTIDVFIKDNNIIESKSITTHMINAFNHPHFGMIHQITINPTNATRFALKKYEAIDLGTTYAPTDEGKVTIYNPGGNLATRSVNTNMYNFGGILKTDENIAVWDFNSKLNKNLVVPQKYIDRGLTDAEVDNNLIISADDDGLNIEKMMKFEFYFWYEGWDADCFEAATKSTCSISLKLTTQNPKLIS